MQPTDLGYFLGVGDKRREVQVNTVFPFGQRSGQCSHAVSLGKPDLGKRSE